MAEVMTGTKHAHHVAESLVHAAVAETLARVCSDYPLDYTHLMERYEVDVVRVCCEASVGSEDFVQCEALTLKSRRCCRRAVMGGYCSAHLDAWTEKVDATRRLETYAAKVAKVEPPRVASHKVSMVLPSLANIRDLL